MGCYGLAEADKGRIGLKFGLIACDKLGPTSVGVGMKPLAQFGGRCYFLVPPVIMECVVRESAGPKAVNIHPVTVIGRGYVVSSFKADSHNFYIVEQKIQFTLEQV